jgi:type IV secretory pathway TraG/TraD family ATPase VirD4
MMEPCVNPAKPVWFVLDELASLNKLPQLHTAVTENRKYGNPIVLGFQGRSQLEKRYGQDAEAMLSQPATKTFFKTSEPRAAKWISETLGEIEVERLKESRTAEMIGSRKSYSMEIATKPLIMASEIAGLEPLHGFVKQENKVVPVNFAYVEKRSLQPAFIERKMTVREPRPVVMPELPSAVNRPPKAIQALTTEAPPLSAARQVPQIAATPPHVVPHPVLPLFVEAASPESTPDPRKSAFKKEVGNHS